jgi:hypothetical protein
MNWLNRKNGQSLAGAIFGLGKKLEGVQPGTIFRRIHHDDLVETAQVESVAADPYGIPHVKFKVVFSRPNRFSYEEGTRMLALKTFAEMYREQVPA